jgi:LCP family protein required for cell wall assembly
MFGCNVITPVRKETMSGRPSDRTAPYVRPAAGLKPAPGTPKKPAPGRRPGWIAGKAGYVISCFLAAVALLASGLSYRTVQDLQNIGSSHAITSGPSIGAQNILLMGLESRRYWNGDILPPGILAQLHAGSASAVAAGAGGNATNTLILIHIPAGGRKAVGFSIPRDDWVQFADTIGPQQSGKIDQAYGVSMFYRQQQLTAQDPGISKNQLAFLGNEAGQAAAVATVEKLTGVHVDHFAAVNLYGFYELAKVIGGVEVCLRHPVHDVKSGANFQAGYHHLNAAQALAFVRQRDGLANGDLDRTHRQQAFLDAVMHKLRAAGVLGDLTKVQALLTVAQHYVITDAGWNLLDFAAQMRGLTSGNLVFHTLPITGYATIDGQDANVVNPAYLKALVNAAFYPPHSPGRGRDRAMAAPAHVTVDVLNGGQTAGLARRVSAALSRVGYHAGKVGNTSHRTSTSVRYGPGAAASARKIATLFGVSAVGSRAVPRGRVQVLLGATAAVPAIQPVSVHPTPSVVIPSTGPQGGAVTAVNGIPCVN